MELLFHSPFFVVRKRELFFLCGKTGDGRKSQADPVTLKGGLGVNDRPIGEELKRGNFTECSDVVWFFYMKSLKHSYKNHKTGLTVEGKNKQTSLHSKESLFFVPTAPPPSRRVTARMEWIMTFTLLPHLCDRWRINKAYKLNIIATWPQLKTLSTNSLKI